MAPDGPAYFTSRGSVMGQVPGEVVAAAFGVFNPAVVIPAVTYGWSITDAKTMCAARDEGAIAQLHRVLGSSPDGAERALELLHDAVAPLRPEGRPLYSGLRALPIPTSLMGAVWRLGDMLREYRGDCHTAAWISAGYTACEIGIVSELYWGLPIKSYSKTRGWTDIDYAEAITRLEDDGIIENGMLTARGRDARENIEHATDMQCRPIIDALGDNISELIDILRPWGHEIRLAKGYPAAGPHDMADTR